MAYSGAIPLCSGSVVYPNEGYLPLILSMIFAAMVLFGIALNNKGRRTIIASIIGLLGLGVLVVSQAIFPSMTLYYLAVAIMFSGIWYNGSFSYFYKKIKRSIHPLAFSSKTNINDDSR